MSCLEDQQDQVVWAASVAPWGRAASVASAARRPGGVGGVGGPGGPGGVGGVGGPGGVGGVGGPGGVGGVGGPGGPGVSVVSAVPEDRVASAASVAPEGVRDGDCFSNSLLSEEPLGRHHARANKLAQQ